MCGYDRSRFINLDDDDEYTCFICKNIYNDPVELPCCKNLVCKACIEIWASNNSTCPLDKRRIDSKNLQKPARQFINLMSKMKLKCEFFNKGCQAIYELGEIKRHEEECDFNICENCCFKVGKKSDHNCISNLKLELQNQREALNKQKSLFFEAEIKSKRDCSKLKLEYDKECINLKIKCEELRLKYAKELEVLKLRQIKDRSSISQLTESNEILSKENSDLKTILQKYERIHVEVKAKLNEAPEASTKIDLPGTLVKEKVNPMIKEIPLIRKSLKTRSPFDIFSTPISYSGSDDDSV